MDIKEYGVRVSKAREKVFPEKPSEIQEPPKSIRDNEQLEYKAKLTEKAECTVST